MADGKEYVSRPDELGNIHISEEVLAVIAAAAAMEVEGLEASPPIWAVTSPNCWAERRPVQGHPYRSGGGEHPRGCLLTHQVWLYHY